MEDNTKNPITPQEFAKKIKSKYPQYKDIDDVTLTNKMIEKYPEYASQVSLKKKESSQPTSQESLWGSNSQPKDLYTSLVTDQQVPQQESDSLNGPGKKKPVSKKKPVAPKQPTEEDYFTGAFGNVLRGFDEIVPLGIGDFIDDMSRSVASGYRQGDVSQAADQLMLSGKKVSNEEIQKFISANKNAQKLKPSAEMQDYQNTYENEGKGFWGVVKGLAKNPSIVPELIVGSLTSMATNTDSLKAGGAAIGTGAGYGAVGGAFAGGIGAVPGAIGGAVSAIPVAFGLASGVAEMGATFSELLTEELNGGEMTKENVRAILENPEKLKKIRNKAIARGAVIGTVDALTGKLASGVGAKIIGKSAAKSISGVSSKTAKIAATGVGSGIESVGGSSGEALARLATGQKMDTSEIALEGIAELPGGIRSTIQASLQKPSYKVNGQNVSEQDLDDLISTMTPGQLQKTNIQIKNDFSGKNKKIQEKLLIGSIKENVKKVNPELNEPTVDAIVNLEKELRDLNTNDTQVGKDKASEIKQKIKEIQTNPLPDSVASKTNEEVITYTPPIDEQVTKEEVVPTAEVTPIDEQIIGGISQPEKKYSLIDQYDDYHNSVLENEKSYNWEKEEANEYFKDKKKYIQIDLDVAKRDLEKYPDSEFSKDSIKIAEERLKELNSQSITEETKPVKEKISPEQLVSQYKGRITAIKESDPEQYWSVDIPSDDVILDAAKNGRLIDKQGGMGIVTDDGNMIGMFKYDKESKGTAQAVQEERVKLGGIKLDNFDGYLTKLYQKNGFRVVSRVPFNEEYAPDDWNKEKHGTPDVVAMVYDPNNELDIEEKTFEDYDEAMAYRDSFVDQAKTNTEAKDLGQLFDESENVVASKDLPALVTKAKTALSKILPNVDVILHDNEDAYAEAVGEVGDDVKSNGAFINNTVHINKNKANGRTVAHEVFHAILLNAVKTDANAAKVTLSMINSVMKSVSPEMKSKLQDFVESGYDSQKELWNEEKLAELVGYLADNYDSLSRPNKTLVKQWLDQIAKLFGLKQFTDNEVVDLLNAIAGKVSTGEAITEEDVKILKPKTTASLIKRFQANFTDPVSKVEFVYDKNTDKFKKLEEQGFITRDKSINDFDGQTIFLHQPDAAFSGEINKGEESLVSGKGGIFYPIKFHDDGYFWASTANTANKMAKDLNAAREANGGKLLMALTTAPSDKLLSSTTASNGVMEIVISKAFDKNFSITPTQVKKSLVDAANMSSVINGKKVGLGLNLKNTSTIEDVRSEISKKLNPDNSSFADRKAFVEKLLSNVADIVKTNPKAVNQFGNFFSEGIKNEAFKGKSKTGKLSISAANLKQGISEMLTEPMLKEGVDRNKGGQVYAILEIDGEVKAVDSNKHESYPKAIQSVDPDNKVKLHVLKDRVKWSDVFEDPKTNEIVTKERELNIFPTSGVSTTGLKLNTKNVPGRKQIIGEKAVKDKLVQNNLDVAKKMEAENKSAKDIFIATGWEKGVDNEWKYDMQEGVVEFKNKKSGKASEVLNYPELFKAYPKAKDINITFMNSDKFEGMYIRSKNRIMLSNSLSDSELKSTLLHEVQHFIQNEEGFAVGGTAQTIKDLYNERIKFEKNFSVKKVLRDIKDALFGSKKKSVKDDLNKLSKLVNKSDEELYKSIAGEVEAFNVEKRSKMTAEERKAQPMSETAENPEGGQIIIGKSDTMLKDRKQTDRPSVNKIYEKSEKAIKDRKKTSSIKDLGPYLRKSLLDRQAYIKRILDRVDNKSAKKAYDLLVTKAGASALAAERFKQAEKEIYGKLNSEDTKTLDKIIYARRIVSVNENRSKLGMPEYKGMDGYSLDNAKLDLSNFKEELGDKKFNDLSDRATTYFNVFKENLRKLYDSGRITKEVYDSLRNTEYSPIKTIKYIIGDNLSVDEIDTQAKSLGISRKDIMKLSDSNENEIILDSKWLLAMNIGSVEGRAFENRMLSEFDKAVRSATPDEKKFFEEFILDNPAVGKNKDGGAKYKYDDVKVPVGYSKVSYFENGNKREIVLKDIYAKQLLDVKSKNTFLETIGKLTGTQILRFFATGGNPLFIIGNTAVDFQNIAFWSDTYSKFKPLAAVQLMRDFTKNFIKKVVINNKYNDIFNEYINHGGALDYLSNDGLKALESLNPVKTVTKQVQKGLLAYGRAMSFLGETSEVAFRLSVFEKVKEDSIKEFKKENNREPNFQEKEDILFKAAREARETMDFSQGGDVAKNIDAVFPYFNAALQGIRRPIDFATKNPFGFGFSVLQYTAMAGSLTAASLAMLIKSVRDDEEDDEKANKKILEALNSISEYEKANYHVLFTGNKNKDGEYEYYRVKKLPVLSVISTIGDQLIYNDFFKNAGVDYKIDDKAILESLVKSNPLPITVQELAGKNPVASGLVSYWSNKDTFTGEKIFREPSNKKILPEAQGIFDDKVAQVYKDLAPKVGLSPVKTQVMIEKVITSENTNPTIALIYSAYDGMFNKKDGLGSEASEAMSNVGKAFGKKLVRYTDKNVIRYKKQDEMEYNESVIETDIWKKEQKVYNEIKGAYKDGGSLTEKEFVEVIKKNFEPIDQEKYAKKYFTYINNMNVDKSVLDIIFEDVPEVQAMKLNERYGSNLEETEIKELEETMRASRRKLNRKAIYIYNQKYKNRKPAN